MSAPWPLYHRRHTVRIAQVIALPWAAQGLSAVVLVAGSGPGDVVVAVGLAVLAAVPVLVTVVDAVPVHARIRRHMPHWAIRRLLLANLVRTIAWTVSTVISGVLLAG